MYICRMQYVKYTVGVQFEHRAHLGAFIMQIEDRKPLLRPKRVDATR